MDIQLLGRPAILVDGEDLAPRIKYRKGMALLGYLAMHPGAWQQRERLGDLLWPELDVPVARANLRQTLSNLTSVLDAGGCLSRDRDAVRFVPAAGLRLDLELLSDAVLARVSAPGPGARDWREREIEPRARNVEAEFLEGLALPDAPEFERWLADTRAHVQHRAGRLLSRLCEAQRADGRLGDAIGTARRLVRLDPLDEAHTIELASVLLDAGERTDALHAIDTHARALRAEVGTAPGAAVTALRERIAALAGRASSTLAPTVAELRWVTVLYCDAGLRDDDPHAEDGRWIHAVRAAVARRGGAVLATLGRGFLAAFGVGAGTEQAVVRAVLAARDMEHRLAETWPLRIGICAGQALCRIEGEVPHVMGDLPERAIRLGWAADRGEVLLDETAARLAGERVCVLPAGDRTGQAMGGAHTVFRLGPAGAEPEGAGGAAPMREPTFVGRDEDMLRLREAWAAASAGAGRVVLVRGRPGLGKTRLAREMAQWVEQQGARVHRVSCRHEVQHRSFAPLVACIASDAGTDAGLDPSAAERRARVRARLRALAPTLDAAHEAALVELLDVAAGPTETPGVGKDAAFAAIQAWFDARVVSAPTMVLVDDLHWADEATREWVDVLARVLQGRRVLVLVTSRPVDAEPWVGRAAVLDLAPLSADASLELVRAACADAGMDPGEQQRIATASAGIPLFAERMAKAWAEGMHHWRPIQELLQAELDALGADKLVVRAASVLGEQFDIDELTRLVPECDVVSALLRAAARGLVVRRGATTHAFRHALIRDAAYEGLPVGRRQALHLAAARDAQSRGDARAEDVARHLSGAGAWAEAAAWWERAARAAMTGGYAAAAMAHGRQLIDALRRCGIGSRDARAQNATLLLGFATQMAEGYGSKAAYDLFEGVAAQLEAEPAPDLADGDRRVALFAALGGMFMGGSSQGAVDGLRIARRLQALARSPTEQLTASTSLGNALFWAGAFEEAHAWQRQGIALGERIAAAERVLCGVDDPAVVCRAFAAWTLWFRGDSDAAVAMADDAVRVARRERRVHALCFALVFATGVHWFREDVAQVVALAGEAHALARHHGFVLWEGASGLFLAWAHAASGETSARAAALEAAAMLSSAYKAGITTSRWIAARALIALGAWHEADELLDITVREAHLHEDQYCLPDLVWLQGLCLSAGGRLDAAQARFDAAIDMARRTGAQGLRARFERTRAAPAMA